MNNKTVVIFIPLLLVLLLVGACSPYQRSKVCGTHTEKYTTSVKGCDGIENCMCLHKAVLGLGACDSCECTREVSNC